MQATNYPTLYSNAELAAAKPTNRAELRKIIKAAAGRFEGQTLTFRQSVELYDRTTWEERQVAVGSIKVEFDESDPLILFGKLIYRHDNPTTRAQSDAILDALCSTVTVGRIGPVAAYIDAHDSHSDRVAGTPYFQCGFRIKCPS